MAGRRGADIESPVGDPGVLRALALFAIGAGVLGNIVYALTDGRTRVIVTIFSVLAFFFAAVLHAASESGRALIAVIVGCVFFGLFVEFLGVRLGFPFGTYTYAKHVWMQPLGVPIVVPLAWAMLGWPAFVAGRFVGQPLLGAPILAAWDLFLDPQMVADKHWSWAASAWPRINGIPLSNLLGWLAAGAAMMFILNVLVGHQITFEGLPLMVLAWTWFASIVGNLFFFGKASVAVIGGIGLTLALAPVAYAFLQVMGRSSPRRGGSSYADTEASLAASNGRRR